MTPYTGNKGQDFGLVTKAEEKPSLLPAGCEYEENWFRAAGSDLDLGKVRE